MNKINRNKAKKLYSEGYDVYVIPCKVRFDFDSMWIKPIKVTHDFDKFMNEFAFYNLNNDVGTYAHYYIEY